MEKWLPKGIGMDANNPLFQSMYLMMRRSACDCGYDPESKKTSPTAEDCPVTQALSNHITFPSVKIMPDVDDSNKIYYDQDEGTPLKHWCFLVELHELKQPRRWSGFTPFGELVTVDFQNEPDEKPTTFAWSDLKAGNTLAILYAEKQDRTEIVEENLDSCYVFKSNLIDLLEEAKRLLNDSDMNAVDEKSSCFGCGVICEKISRCGNCKLAKYCSRECQAKCWKEVHKKLCSQNETILRLSALPRQPFTKHFSFTNGDDDSLPPYVFKPEFAYKPIATDKTSLKEIESKNLKPEQDTKCGLCNQTNQQVFLKKGKPLTKTSCCNNWICDDHHTYVVNTFLRNSCQRNHDRYTICGYHHTENHDGKWQDCRVCKRGMPKIDYIDKSTNDYNFANEKLDIKNRVKIKCATCSFESDNMNNFAGKITHKNGDAKFYCKKSECKKAGEFDGPDDSFLVKYMLK